MIPFWCALILASSGDAAREDSYYTVDYLTPPAGAVVEVGGMDWLPDGRLALSTRRGQVWLVENPLAADPAQARFQLFAEGLQEGLGLAVVDGEIYVLQRGELSRLRDVDGDGTADAIDTISNRWGNSGHYHEFAFGLPRDAAGNFYISLNVSFGDPEWWLGRSTVPYRGWVLRIAPDGTTTPFACGFRSPCGLGMNLEGDLFETDNQGDWMPACPIFHVKQDRFYGHPVSLSWTDEYLGLGRRASDTIPPQRRREPAAIWIPYDWSRSTGNLVPDSSAGKFGPFAGQMFVAEMTNGYVLRAQMEKVRGEYQGAVFPFRKAVGSTVRLSFAPDGTLFAGFTDRGWGGQSPGSGVGRVRWTGRTPLEIESVHLAHDGFDVAFTQPVAQGSLDAAAIEVEQYDYDYWWDYGSPKRHTQSLPVASAALDADGRRAHLEIPGLAAAMVARVHFDGVQSRDGAPLLHPEFAYTVNQLLDGAPTEALVAKEVPPPPPRESGSEGVLALMHTDALDAWQGSGWVAGGVELDPADSTRLVAKEEAPPPDRHRGQTLHPDERAQSTPLVSHVELGDFDTSFYFLMPKSGRARLLAHGRYGVILEEGRCGALEGSETAPERAPDFNAYRGPGEWHSFSARFQAPRFDASGQKISNARFQRVMIDDVLLQDEIEVAAPSAGAVLPGESAHGPLAFASDAGSVALRQCIVRDRSTMQPADEEGWTRIFDGQSLDGWRTSGKARWTVENGALFGSGDVGHIFSPRGDYVNFELRARVRINDKGNSGMYFRAAYGEGWPAGYEAQINSSHADPVKTGSLYNFAAVRTQLIPPDTWFTYHVVCRDEDAGVHVTISVNNVVVNDYVDAKRTHASGHVAFQQHNEGSEVRVRDIEVRALP